MVIARSNESVAKVDTIQADGGKIFITLKGSNVSFT